MAMDSSKNLIDSFYKAFSEGNSEQMKACYDAQIEFEDPAFGKLHGKEVGEMWRMLLSNKASQLRINYTIESSNEHEGKVRWTAEYLFGKDRRPVVNKVTSTLEISGGKIIRQKDEFNFWKWSKQALGLSGALLGWTSLLQNKVQATTRKRLNDWMNQPKNI